MPHNLGFFLNGFFTFFHITHAASLLFRETTLSVIRNSYSRFSLVSLPPSWSVAKGRWDTTERHRLHPPATAGGWRFRIWRALPHFSAFSSSLLSLPSSQVAFLLPLPSLLDRTQCSFTCSFRSSTLLNFLFFYGYVQETRIRISTVRTSGCCPIFSPACNDAWLVPKPFSNDSHFAPLGIVWWFRSCCGHANRKISQLGLLSWHW